MTPRPCKAARLLLGRMAQTVCTGALLLCLLAAGSSAWAQATPERPVVQVSLLFDGPWTRNEALRALFQTEIRELTEREFDVRFADAYVVTADWTRQGVHAAVDRLLADPEVDVLITLGIIASQYVARMDSLPKPTLAPLTVDPALQGLPSQGNATGVPNLNYLTFPNTLQRDLEAFRRIVDFDRVIGPPVPYPVQIRLSGDDPDVIFGIADAVKERLDALPGVQNINDNWGTRTKKLEVRVDGPRARRAGVTNRDVAISLQTALSGFETTQYREDDQLIPIVLRSVAADRNDLGKLETINVYAQATGQNVPLKSVADIALAFEPSKILRRNRTTTVTVQAALDLEAGVTSFDVVEALEAWLAPASRDWPLGFTYAYGGEVESSGKAQASIGAKLPIAALLIVLLLVGQFNSLRKPAIILLTIPLGIIGVVLGLLLTNQIFGFMALLGIISLSGIVINNAIVLIDRIQIEMDENGLDPARAVIEATQRRLRPILLTTATTVGGLVPLWLGGGPLFESMAVAILFGLLFATVLTLGFVPTLYSLFNRVSFRTFPDGDLVA